MTYRDDLAALTARAAALDHEVAERTRERDDVRRLIAEARRDDDHWEYELRHASPCSASWDAMDGDDRVRHCATCRKDVYNFSAMTRREVEDLLVAREGKVCSRFYQRRDGTVLLADCTVGLSRKRHKLVFAGAVAASLSAAAVGHAIHPRATTGGDVAYAATMGAVGAETDVTESIGGDVSPEEHERRRQQLPPPPVSAQARTQAIAVALRAGQHAERPSPTPPDLDDVPADAEIAKLDCSGDTILHPPPHLPRPVGATSIGDPTTCERR